MSNRKELKKKALQNVKLNYIIYVIACVIIAWFGVEFSGSLRFTMVRDAEDFSVVEHYYKIEKMGSEILDIPNNELIKEIVEAANGDLKNKNIQVKKVEIINQQNNPFARKEGVFATLVNTASNGNFLVKIARAGYHLCGSPSVVLFVMASVALLLVLFLALFLYNTYRVVYRRIFLEGRIYHRMSPNSFLFLIKKQKWLKVTKTMFIYMLYLLLWSFTLVGVVIKSFSYYLVPYIVAENPDIEAKAAIALSRKMMKGHKWQCFLYEVSFMGWRLLSILTLGLVGTFFADPYRIAFFSEFYAEVRREAKENGLEGVEQLNDRYLFEKATPQLLKETYTDTEKLKRKISEEKIEYKGASGLFAKVFGIFFRYSEQQKKYDEYQCNLIKYNSTKNQLEGYGYPDRLSPINQKEKRLWVERVNYTKHYYIFNLILIFITASFIGWLWEVVLHLLQEGELVNRGVMHGPWLPIYGYGTLSILVLLKGVRRHPIIEFAFIIVICGTMEYFAGYYLEMVHGTRWWDYSGYYMNLDGRICAEALLTFGLGGICFVYICCPVLDIFISKIKRQVLIPVALVLVAVFVMDTIYSQYNPNKGNGVTSNVKQTVNEEIIW